VGGFIRDWVLSLFGLVLWLVCKCVGFLVLGVIKRWCCWDLLDCVFYWWWDLLGYGGDGFWVSVGWVVGWFYGGWVCWFGWVCESLIGVMGVVGFVW